MTAFTLDLSGFDQGGSPLSVSTDGTTPNGVGSTASSDPYSIDSGSLLPGDLYDSSKMQGATTDPTQAGSTSPWYENVIKYGIGKIVDATTGAQATAGNTSPGSFAGQNGRSYPQNIAAVKPLPVQVKGDGVTLLLLALGVYLLVK